MFAGLWIQVFLKVTCSQWRSQIQFVRTCRWKFFEFKRGQKCGWIKFYLASFKKTCISELVKCPYDCWAVVAFDWPASHRMISIETQISLLGERLECLMVQQRFGDNLVEIEKKLNNFKHVCDLLLKGQGIRSVVWSHGFHKKSSHKDQRYQPLLQKMFRTTFSLKNALYSNSR